MFTSVHIASHVSRKIKADIQAVFTVLNVMQSLTLPHRLPLACMQLSIFPWLCSLVPFLTILEAYVVEMPWTYQASCATYFLYLT